MKALSVAAVFLLAGCSDFNTSIDEAPLFAKGRASNGSEWSLTDITDATSNDSADVVGSTDEPSMLRHAPDAPRLESYDTSFVAVQGQQTRFFLYYENEKRGGRGVPFMEIYIPWDAQLLNGDGEPAALGERITITVHADPEYFYVRFGPHGSTFVGWFPAILTFYTKHADLEGMPGNSLNVWYQPYDNDPWEEQATTWVKRGNKLQAKLYHFSNYAIAW